MIKPADWGGVGQTGIEERSVKFLKNRCESFPSLVESNVCKLKLIKAKTLNYSPFLGLNQSNGSTGNNPVRRAANESKIHRFVLVTLAIHGSKDCLSRVAPDIGKKFFAVGRSGYAART